MVMSNPGSPTDGAGGVESGGGANFGQILEQAQRMQAAMLAAQEELAATRVDGTAGGGLVRATVNGGGELVDLVISPAAVDPSDTETLADLVVAAVRDATTNAHRLAAAKMSAVTGGLGGVLGGLGGGSAGGGGGLGGSTGLGGLGLPGLG